MVDPTDKGSDRDPVPTISELIHKQRDTGLTYRQMSQRASESGYPVKYQQLQELATQGPKEWPKRPATIRGLAAALDVSERAVVLAFAASFDLDVTEGASLLEVLLPVGTRDVDAGLQQAIAGVVRAAVAAQHEDGGSSGDTAPIAHEIHSEHGGTRVGAAPAGERKPSRKGAHPNGS